MRIYLVRHGETDWNKEGRFQGIEDIQLNETGIQQAKICAEGLLDYTFDAIYTSPLKRAYYTASIIADERKKHGNDKNQSMLNEVTIDERILERDFGLVSGLLPEERKQFLETNKDAKMEDFDHLTHRVMGALESYRLKHKDGQVLVVTHGGVINAVAHELSEGEIGTGKTYVANTCVTILDDADGKLRMVEYNKKLK